MLDYGGHAVGRADPYNPELAQPQLSASNLERSRIFPRPERKGWVERDIERELYCKGSWSSPPSMTTYQEAR
jgi:hypothetical protein